MKASDIKTKCLPVVENLNEFATKLEDIDQNTEDYCAYITSLADIFYWLNIESVWGKMGFQWDVIDEKGHFTNTVLTYNIIPRIPDGQRIKDISNLLRFNNDEIIIQKSNWENVNYFGPLIYSDNYYGTYKIKKLHVNFEGSDIIQQKHFTNGFHLGQEETYYKIDFKKLSSLILRCYPSKVTNFIINEDNKYLNIPMNLTTGNYRYPMVIVWEGEGPYKDEYAFNIQSDSFDSNSMYISIYSKNDEYYLKNFYYKIKPYSQLPYNKYNYITKNNIEDIINNTKNTKPVYLTIESLPSNKDIDLIIDDVHGFRQHYKGLLDRNEYNASYKQVKINIIGEYDTIPVYKYSELILQEYGDFDKQFDNTIIYKLRYPNKYEQSNHNIGIFSTCLFDYIPDYTWDIENLNIFCAFDDCVFYDKTKIGTRDYKYHFESLVDASKRYIQGYNTKINILNIKNLKEDCILYIPEYYVYLKEGYYVNSLQENFNYKCKELIGTKKQRDEYFIPNTTVIECNLISYLNFYIDVKNHIYFILNCEEIIKINLSKTCKFMFDETYSFSYDDKINILQIKNFTKNNREVLKQSTINTVIAMYKCTIEYPILLSNANTLTFTNCEYTNIKFIYKTTCDFSKAIRGQTFIDQLLEAIEPNDSDSTYTITIRNEDYLLLTQEQIEYITITCNYILVNKIV